MSECQVAAGYERDEKLVTARRVFGAIGSAMLVSLRDGEDGSRVILDGDWFTAEQLEAIAYLMRHDPATLEGRSPA